MNNEELTQSLSLIDIKGKKFSAAALKALLPDVPTVLFFGKVYQLSAQQLGELLHLVFNTDLTAALFGEQMYHSMDLQYYLEDTLVPHIPSAQAGELKFISDPVPQGEILPHLWEQAEVEIAASIAEVAAKLAGVVDAMPGKEGQMIFRSLMQVNAKRPTLGAYKAQIHHERRPSNLVVFDVSGSMTSDTVRRIVDDVVALSYKADAHLAIVSNTCTFWAPGTFTSKQVLDAAEFGGTRYEQLAPILNRDWGVVVSIADYDSDHRTKSIIAQCSGSIDVLYDLSLVDRPTFLAEVLGTLAKEVRPLLVGNSGAVLSR